MGRLKDGGRMDDGGIDGRMVEGWRKDRRIGDGGIDGRMVEE